MKAYERGDISVNCRTAEAIKQKKGGEISSGGRERKRVVTCTTLLMSLVTNDKEFDDLLSFTLV